MTTWYKCKTCKATAWTASPRRWCKKAAPLPKQTYRRADITKDGETLNLDLLKTSFSIQGLFDSASDSYDAKRHYGMRVEKVASTTIAPHIIEVKDAVSGTMNSNLSSNGVFH